MSDHPMAQQPIDPTIDRDANVAANLERLSAARPETPPTCPFCHLRFPSRAEVLDHVARDHPERTPARS